MGNFERRFRKLIKAHGEPNRKTWALEWMNRGGKVLGMVDPYIPEEVPHAAGILPWRVTGTWKTHTPMANVYRPINSCGYCNHVLESVLSGDLDFLYGLVCTDWDDDTRRLWDVLRYATKMAYIPMVHVPHKNDSRSSRFYAEVLRQAMWNDMVQMSDGGVTEEALSRSIEIHNQTRLLLRRIYEMRKREIPPLSGQETLSLTLAARIMPKEEFNSELGDLMDFLERREANLKTCRPRLLVASEHLDNPAFLGVLENSGAVVAMDDMDTGSQYVWTKVEKSTDSFYSLAQGYLSRPASPRMSFWDQHVEQVIRWVGEFKIDGVINFPQMYDYERLLATPYFENRLRDEGIPVMTIVREYHLANLGQLRTRVEAFLEML